MGRFSNHRYFKHISLFILCVCIALCVWLLDSGFYSMWDRYPRDPVVEFPLLASVIIGAIAGVLIWAAIMAQLMVSYERWLDKKEKEVERK